METELPHAHRFRALRAWIRERLRGGDDGHERGVGGAADVIGRCRLRTQCSLVPMASEGVAKIRDHLHSLPRLRCSQWPDRMDHMGGKAW